MDIDKAILLLKQWGTPVWASAMAGAKFLALSKIIISITIIAFTVGAIVYLRPWMRSRPETSDMNITKIQAKLIVFVVSITLLFFCIGFMIDGFYGLTTLDYQAYKMMMLK